MTKLLAAALVLLACAPALSDASLSPWFSSSFTDMHRTLRRYSRCVHLLEPIHDRQLNASDYLLKQVAVFLDVARLSVEQLANVTRLADSICRPRAAAPAGDKPALVDAYPVSSAINATQFAASKKLRCQALDDAMSGMYPLLKAAAANRSEPLDFSAASFAAAAAGSHSPAAGAASKTPGYNLTDLINTAWISANATHDRVCALTNSIKAHVANLTLAAAAAGHAGGASRRSESGGEADGEAAFVALPGFVRAALDAILERFLALQRAAYWESSTRWQQLTSGLEFGVRSTADSVTRSLGGARGRLFGRARDAAANATAAANSSLSAAAN